MKINDLEKVSKEWLEEASETTPAAILELIAAYRGAVAALDDAFYFLERHSNRLDGINGKHPNEVADAARAALATAKRLGVE